MAHFAKINVNTNQVVHISVVDNWNIVDGEGNEVESIGIAYLESVHGSDSNFIWRQTSYNNNMRKNYAGIGMTWDAGRNAFIPPKPFNSWTLNEDTCRWDPPTPMPNDGKMYSWNEETLSWVEQI
jgi:hypothetical protein